MTTILGSFIPNVVYMTTDAMPSGTHKRTKLEWYDLEAKQTGHLRDCGPQGCWLNVTGNR